MEKYDLTDLLPKFISIQMLSEKTRTLTGNEGKYGKEC